MRLSSPAAAPSMLLPFMATWKHASFYVHRSVMLTQGTMMAGALYILQLKKGILIFVKAYVKNMVLP